MSLKAELQTWAAALKAYDEQDFEKSLDLFSAISDTSKIFTNIGLIYATLGEHELAVEQFNSATSLDQYLAVAYFQCGVSNFLLTRYDLAFKDFDEALLYLRGNQSINYEQLGLKFKLYSAEVLFNKGLAQIYLGNTQAGLEDMEVARGEKATDEHNVIDDAIQDRGDGYTVFSIPVGILYRPSESKLKNVKTKDYLGKAKLVAAADSADAYTTFSGITRLKQGISPSGVYVDRIDDDPGLSRAPSASVPKPPNKEADDMPRATTLARAKTTLNVPADREARIAGLTQPRAPIAPNPSGALPSVAPLQRARSTTNPRENTERDRRGAGSPNFATGDVQRKGSAPSAYPAAPTDRREGLAERMGRASLDDTRAPSPPIAAAPAPAPVGRKGARVTEFYDNYLDSYGADEAAPPPPPAPERVAAWARTNAVPGAPPSVGGGGGGGGPGTGIGIGAAVNRMQSARSAYAPSSFGGGGGAPRRRLTRKGTSRGPSRGNSSYGGTYEEEEEGYGSGEYDDSPFELVKIRVKLHYQDDVRGMALAPEMPFDEFLDRVTAKFGRERDGLRLQFRDEDGGKVSLRDDMDYELAIETARESAKGRPEGKLEIWCVDV